MLWVCVKNLLQQVAVYKSRVNIPTKGPCEAAVCKWVRPAVGGPDICVYSALKKPIKSI